MENKDIWLSILSYANQSGMSISTIRRHIKSGQLESKLDDGKYFIKVGAQDKFDLKSDGNLEIENKVLQDRLKRLSEELNDLKTLVLLYESRAGFNPENQLPEIPKA